MVKVDVVQALLYVCGTWTPLTVHYRKLCTVHHRVLLRILGAWCRAQNHRFLSYAEALQRTGCESIETTVRTRRLQWAGALIRMDGFPTGSCLAGWRDRGSAGRGDRKRNGQTVWQKTFGLLALAGTVKLPH